MNKLYFQSNNEEINQVFRIALGDLYGNIRMFQSGLLKEKEPVILAGMHYDTPWTRDAAINVWNGGGIIFPEAAKATLLAVLTEEPEGVRIDGEYWDAIIWATGAWHYYLYTGDKEFLELAFRAVTRSLEWFEEREYVEEMHLFSGAACYGDGIAAYGDEFASINELSPAIANWWRINKDKLEKGCQSRGGIGLPMYVLSTNCLYYQAYRVASWMREELNVQTEDIWTKKADALKETINSRFWDEKNGKYLYYLSPMREDGACDSQEALGIAFAILFGVADERQTMLTIKNCIITPAGIACVWPSFSRYDTEDGMGFGRHSGTVWPHAEGFWADAVKHAKASELFWKEIMLLTEHAYRDQQFGEIYHPITGELYGGLQEVNGPAALWGSCNRQTWSATAYLRMILLDVCGMDFTTKGIHFSPDMGDVLDDVELSGITYRGSEISLRILGKGNKIKSFSMNGEIQEQPFLPIGSAEKIQIEIVMG